MPLTSSLPSLYNTAQRKSRLPAWPLLRSGAHYTWRETYLQNVANFSRTALDTAHPDVASLYLVDEDALELREDLLEFFRIYSTIPAAWDEPLNTRFDFPGYVGVSLNFGTEVSSGVSLANSGTDGRFVITKTAHGLLANSYVRLRFTVSSFFGYYYYALVESVTTDTFTLDKRWVGTATFTSPSYAPIDGLPSRTVRTESVAGFRRHEYALPGITAGVASASAFLPLEPIRFVSAAGEPVTKLTATTEPSSTAWVASARAGSYFVKESSVVPYLGNILERITDYIPYRM